jgi:hypothetical protein
MTISNNASALRPGVCTSITRPTTPYEGQVIYETDTDKILIWSGSTWQPPWNTAWGVLNVSTLAAGTSLSPSGITSIFSVSYTHVANRRMRVTAHFNGSISPATNTALRVRDSGTTIVYQDYVSSAQPGYCVTTHTTSTGSSQTFTVELLYGTNPSSASVNSAGRALLMLEDIGPV